MRSQPRTNQTKDDTKGQSQVGCDAVLDAEVLEALEFKSFWPKGNPEEPWWKNDEMNITFYDGRPTAKQLFAKVSEMARDEGVESVRSAIRDALGI